MHGFRLRRPSPVSASAYAMRVACLGKRMMQIRAPSVAGLFVRLVETRILLSRTQSVHEVEIILGIRSRSLPSFSLFFPPSSPPPPPTLLSFFLPYLRFQSNVFQEQTCYVSLYLYYCISLNSYIFIYYARVGSRGGGLPRVRRMSPPGDRNGDLVVAAPYLGAASGGGLAAAGTRECVALVVSTCPPPAM